MAAMATLGTMASLVSSAAVIAADRSTGWTRQMRITPLTVGTYFGARVLNGYLRALLTIVVLCLAGTALGVRQADSSAVAMAGIVTLFALLGGVYGFQIATSGAMFQVIKAIPSYWLVQAAKTALGHGGWPAEGWIVVAAWTVVLTALAVYVYQRDTRR